MHRCLTLSITSYAHAQLWTQLTFLQASTLAPEATRRLTMGQRPLQAPRNSAVAPVCIKEYRQLNNSHKVLTSCTVFHNQGLEVVQVCYLQGKSWCQDVPFKYPTCTQSANLETCSRCTKTENYMKPRETHNTLCLYLLGLHGVTLFGVSLAGWTLPVTDWFMTTPRQELKERVVETET